MRRLGCIVMLIGLTLASTSLFLFGAAIWRILRPPMAVMVPLPLDGSALPLDARSELPSKLRLWCRVEVDSESVDREGEAWRARYALPLTWRIDDGHGGELAGGSATLDWESTHRTVVDEHGTRASATAIVEHPLARLMLPADVPARAWATIGDDVAWHGSLRRAWLVLRADETEAGALALGGAAVLAVGPMLVATGLAIIVMSFLRRRRARRQAKSQAKQEAQQEAKTAKTESKSTAKGAAKKPAPSDQQPDAEP